MIAKWTTTVFLAAAVCAPAGALAAGDAHPSSAKAAMTDAAITTKVKAKFARDPDVRAMAIKVDTDNGVVTLSGNAKSKMEADKAESIAKDTEGVSSVANEIKVNAAGGSKY